MLDALRRHEAQLALVHVAVVVRIETRAAVELELGKFRRRIRAELVGRLVAGRRILHGAQFSAREEIHRDHRQAAGRVLVFDDGLAAAHDFEARRDRRTRERIFHMSGPVAGERHDPVINRLVIRRGRGRRTQGERRCADRDDGCQECAQILGHDGSPHAP